jgi:thioredoxin-related protein
LDFDLFWVKLLKNAKGDIWMSEELQWESSLSISVKKAVQEKKHVLVVFSGLSCRGCRMMDSITFQNDTVKSMINKSYVPLKFESGRDAEQFLRFQVKGTPTTIILSSDGDETDRIMGYLPPDDLIKVLKDIQSS